MNTPPLSRMIIPVIHYLDDAQAMRNAEIAFDAGCPAVMLIEMGGADTRPVWAASEIQRCWPEKLVGLNFLRAQRVADMPINLTGVDMTWTDWQITHSQLGNFASVAALRDLLAVKPRHLFFCAVAFKGQPHEPDPACAARRARSFGMIPTTSGSGTGVAADPIAVAALRAALGPTDPLALASGVTPDNAHEFLPFVSHVLVSTGISSSFYEFDPARVRALVEVSEAFPLCGCYSCARASVAAHPSPAGNIGPFDPRLCRMFLCPDCGNKRCPKATNHALECSGSNEPGQEGSRYA